MKNRLLIVGVLIALSAGVGAMLFGSASRQVAAERAELVGELLAGGME